jgi:hypothetical protein
MKANALYSENNKRHFIGTRFIAVLAAFLALALLGGCRVEYHDSHHHSPVEFAHLDSDQDADGDIAYTPPATYIVSSARTTGTVLAGVDPVYGDEFRGFLDFYLRDYHGVPHHTRIESATLEIFISDVSEAYHGAGVPLVVDLVAFQPPTLIASDFDRTLLPPLLTLPVEITAADEGTTVAIDVTALMIEAQSQEFPDFQIRLLLDTYATSGLVEIEDNGSVNAPLLTVVYY